MLFQGQKYTCSTYISLHHCIIWIWFDYHYSKTNFVIACYSFFAIKKISVVNTITTVIPSNKYIVFTKTKIYLFIACTNLHCTVQFLLQKCRIAMQSFGSAIWFGYDLKTAYGILMNWKIDLGATFWLWVPLHPYALHPPPINVPAPWLI